tara:strand:- start:560 stop:1303 length:744 start_codon:yes stop_codon:yes gene_type:complete
MAITTRQGLIDYCLRRLGAPVTEINVDDEQISDRIDDAIEFFQEYHFDGVEKVFLKHTVTQTDIDNEYLTVTNAVISVLRVLPIPNFNAFQTGFFNEEYQLRLNDLENFQSSTMINWAMAQTNFSLVEHLFSVAPTLLFNRKQNKVYLETDWSNKFSVGTILIIEAYRSLDPATYTEVYNDMFLKKYATALIKQQWGSNLKKFTGVTLPGGITLDGQTIFTEATEEITKIEEEMNMKYELPPDGIIG